MVQSTVVGTFKPIHWVLSTRTSDQLRVIASDGEVLLQITGPRGGVQAAVRLNEQTSAELISAISKALDVGAEERAGS